MGYDAVYAARLAVREINAAGGVAGTMLELVAYDDRGEAALAARVAENLVVDPEVLAVIGHYLPETTAAAASVYAGASLPHLTVHDAPATAATADWIAAYKSMGPHVPEPGPYALPTYDAVHTLADALSALLADGRTPTRAALGATLDDVTHDG